MSTYQLHVLLHGVEPAIWRRLHVRDDTTLAILHVLIQIAFGWHGVRPHLFVLRGKVYGGRFLADAFSDDIPLAQFGFRSKERFAYRYGAWDVQIRQRRRSTPATIAVFACIPGPSQRSGLCYRVKRVDKRGVAVEHLVSAILAFVMTGVVVAPVLTHGRPSSRRVSSLVRKWNQ